MGWVERKDLSRSSVWAVFDVESKVCEVWEEEISGTKNSKDRKELDLFKEEQRGHCGWATDTKGEDKFKDSLGRRDQNYMRSCRPKWSALNILIVLRCHWRVLSRWVASPLHDSKGSFWLLGGEWDIGGTKMEAGSPVKAEERKIMMLWI